MKRNIYYDCEFLEEGSWKPVELVSIGMIDDQGRTYYAVVDDAVRDYGQGGTDLYARLRGHDWHLANTVPILDDTPEHLVHDRATIAADVEAFIRGGLPAEATSEDVRLWSWYGAYDHVVLCQLFGTMAQLPDIVPMYTGDLQQECDRLGVCATALAPWGEGAMHNALDDATWHRHLARRLREHERLSRVH